MDVKNAREIGLKKVGEVADIFGTTPRTLLYYEEQGIISPKKTAKGTRMYSESDIRRFDVAYKMCCMGVPLKTIKALATTRPNAKSGNESGRKLCSILDDLIGDVQRQIRHLDFMKQDLERGRLMIRLCWDCPNKPSRLTCPNCPCETQMSQSQLLSLTWDPDRSTTTPANPGEPPTKCMEASLPQGLAPEQLEQIEVANKPRRGRRPAAKLAQPGKAPVAKSKAKLSKGGRR